MLYYIGRFLMLVGLLIVPLGVLLSIQYGTLKPELVYLGVGGAAFLAGRAIVKRTGRKGG